MDPVCDECENSVERVYLVGDKEYCIACMNSKSDLFTFRAVVVVYFDEKDNWGEPEFLTIYVKDKEDAIEAKKGILDSSINDMISRVEALDMEEAFELSRENKIHPFHPLTRFKMDSDWPSHTFYYLINDGLENDITEKLLQDFKASEAYKELDSLNAVKKAIKQVHPVLERYHLTYALEDRVKNHLREEENEKLSKKSQQMLGNSFRNSQGEEFEEEFRDYCRERDLEFLKTQIKFMEGSKKEDILNNELSIEFPGISRTIMQNIGEKKGVLKKVSGLPDFLVWGDFEKVDGIESDEKAVFVEVKYNNSKLTDSQKKIFPKLDKLGFQILVFSGTADKSSLMPYEEFE